VPICENTCFNGACCIADYFWGDSQGESFAGQIMRVRPNAPGRAAPDPSLFVHCVFDIKATEMNSSRCRSPFGGRSKTRNPAIIFFFFFFFVFFFFCFVFDLFVLIFFFCFFFFFCTAVTPPAGRWLAGHARAALLDTRAASRSSQKKERKEKDKQKKRKAEPAKKKNHNTTTSNV